MDIPWPVVFGAGYGADREVKKHKICALGRNYFKKKAQKRLKKLKKDKKSTGFDPKKYKKAQVLSSFLDPPGAPERKKMLLILLRAYIHF